MRRLKNKANNFDIALLDEVNTVKNKGRLYNPHENSDTKSLSLGDYNSSDPLPMDIEIYGNKFKTPGGVDAIKN